MKIKRFSCKKPIDFHCHFRQEPLALYLVGESSRYFSKALAMPNTLPPILTPDDVINYGEMLRGCASIAGLGRSISSEENDLKFLLTFKITENTSPDSIAGLKKAGAIAGKLYPGGVTTNSEDGVKDFKALYPVFDAMERNNLVLCVHAELPGSPPATAERDFLPILQDILDNFPHLRVTFEHVSTAVGVDFVRYTKHRLLRATVTPHHLFLTDKMVANNPHLHCKPVCKTSYDRDRLKDIVFRKRDSAFFLGTDSAPHSQVNKLKDPPNAGVYNVSTAIPLLIEEFHQQGVIQDFENFTSIFGEWHYKLEPDNTQIEFIREQWIVPETHDVEGMTGLKMKIKPLGAGQKLYWKLSGLTSEWPL